MPGELGRACSFAWTLNFQGMETSRRGRPWIPGVRGRLGAGRRGRPRRCGRRTFQSRTRSRGAAAGQPRAPPTDADPAAHPRLRRSPRRRPPAGLPGPSHRVPDSEGSDVMSVHLLMMASDGVSSSHWSVLQVKQFRLDRRA